jgi:group I intron endonuclease
VKSGIYVILCEKAGKAYVGSSKHINERFGQHKHDLRKNVHPNKKLQHAYNKYGLNEFEFGVLENCSEDQLLQREQFYIDSLLGDAFRDVGFNLAPIAGRMKGIIAWNKGLKLGKQSTELIQKRVEGRRGYRHSVETRQKIADGNKGKSRHASAETLQKRSVSMRGKNNKSVFKYDALGLIVMWYPSLEMAAESVSGNRSKLSVAIKNGKIFKGYTWKFEKQLELDFIGKWMHDLVKGKSKILQAEIKNNNGIKRNKSAGH